MKILILTSVFYPERFPVIEHVALRLHEEGHHVVVITGQPHYPHGVRYAGYRQWRPTRSEYKGIEVIRVPIMPRGSGSTLSMLFNYASLLCSLTVFGPWMLRKQSFDLCFVNLWQKLRWHSFPTNLGSPLSFLKWGNGLLFLYFEWCPILFKFCMDALHVLSTTCSYNRIPC